MTTEFDPNGAFTFGSARGVGFTRRDLDDRMLDRPFHGLRAARRPVDGDEGVSGPERERIAIERAAESFSAYMGPHEFFSHSTAAALWNLPLPLLRDTRIHVSVPAPHRGPRAAGVRGHQLSAKDIDVVIHPTSGMRLTSPVSTWGLLGALLRHPYDLVAAADGLLRVDRVAGPRGFVKRPALAAAADLRTAVSTPRRGVVALRAALPRVRAGAASRPETWTRLTIVDAGLPEPVTDFDVYAGSQQFIGCVDLAYVERRIAIEYEGDHHRTSVAQWNRDLEKHEALVRAGWRVIRVTADMLFRRPDRLTASVREALRERAA